jgi:hypothetical protein
VQRPLVRLVYDDHLSAGPVPSCAVQRRASAHTRACVL